MNTETVSISGPDAGALPSFHSLLRRCFVRMLPGLLCAGSLAGRLEAAEQQDSPRDFLMMKLYEAALKAVEARTTAQNSPTPQPGSGHASNGPAWTPPDYGCALWLETTRATNNASNVVVTLHNTIPGTNYQILSKTNLGDANWSTETNVTGAGGQDWTAVSVPMNGRPQLFFLGAASIFGITKSFVGLQSTNSLAPVPDAMGAVGPNHYVQVLNAESNRVGIAVFDRCSGNLLQSATNMTFFHVQFEGTNYPTGTTFDPRVAYDHEAQRWVATILDLNTRQLLLAVSKSSSPLDLLTNWDRYLLPVSVGGSKADFGTLGIDKNGIYISVAQQDEPAGTVSSNVIMTLKKPEIYQGVVISNPIPFLIHSNELPVSAIFPAVNYDAEPRGGYVWFVAKKWSDRSSTNGGALCYRRMVWNGTNVDWAPADTNWVEVPNSPVYRDYFDLDKSGVTAPQATGGLDLQIYDTGSRVLSAVIQNGSLWTCQQIGLSGTNGLYPGPGGSTNVDRSGVQWLKISTDTNGEFLSITNGRIFDPTNSNPYYYYCPSVAVNQFGDLVAGFNGSRSGEYVRACYRWRSHTGVQASQPLVIRVSQDEAYNNSWGDYSAASLDPLDRLRIWLILPLVPAGALDNPWVTWIDEIIPGAPDP